MSLTTYQENIEELLQVKFNALTKIEWRTQMNAGLYSPILDIAVGPFAMADGTQLSEDYDELFLANLNSIQGLVLIHLRNLKYVTDETAQNDIELLINQKIDELKYTNFNPRCFIAVEIENSVSRKHLMGGALNACALGRIAIAVGYTEEKHRAFLNLYRYFTFLQQVHKPTFRTGNLLIISAEQLHDFLES